MKAKNRIGIVGGGQLGRMLGIAAKQMGFWVGVTDPTPRSPAGQVVDYQIVADYNDEAAIRKLAGKVDFLTFEIELANAKILDELSAAGVMINPSAKTLEVIKDKLKQKRFLKKAKIPTADFVEVTTKSDVEKAANKFGYPLLLKARMDAYDGRGNVLIKKAGDIGVGLIKLSGRKLYVEKLVPFKKELAVMVARSLSGEIVAYPVVETIHEDNICHTVIAPATVSMAVAKKAGTLAKKVMQKLKGAGIFGIEMFLSKDNKVLVNEIAPRVHNSGHYTIEGCVTNQFAQHIRAITGMPLGESQMVTGAAVMVNILGDRLGRAKVENLSGVLQLPNVSVHIYGKYETKPQRKMGHITVVGDNVEDTFDLAKRAREMIFI